MERNLSFSAGSRKMTTAERAMANGRSMPCHLGVLIFCALVTIVITGCVSHQPSDWQDVRRANAEADMQTYRQRGPKLTEPLTLSQAIAYAQQYNIDVWMAANEREYQHELTTHAKLAMMPTLAAGAEYAHRDKYDASSSQSLTTGKESLELSYSSEKTRNAFDLSSTWSLLDFGIGFYRVRQQEQRELIALMRERRLQQTLALQVTQLYWQAVAARESARTAEVLSRDVMQIIETLRKETSQKSISTVDGLAKETALLSQLEELRRYPRAYQQACTELARAIGLPPGTPLTLADVDFNAMIPPASIDIDSMENEALTNRPELYEKDFDEAISRDEVRITIAQMFPNVSLFYRYEWDANRFLAYDTWNTLGVRTSWDLLAIPSQIKAAQSLELQGEMIRRQRTGVAIAILTQLHLALIEYNDLRDRYKSTHELSTKFNDLLSAVQKTAKEGKSNPAETLDYKLRALRSRAKYLTTCALLHTSMCRIENTLGRYTTGAATLPQVDASLNTLTLPTTDGPATQPSTQPATYPTSTAATLLTTQPALTSQHAVATPTTRPSTQTSTQPTTRPAHPAAPAAHRPATSLTRTVPATQPTRSRTTSAPATPRSSIRLRVQMIDPAKTPATPAPVHQSAPRTPAPTEPPPTSIRMRVPIDDLQPTAPPFSLRTLLAARN